MTQHHFPGFAYSADELSAYVYCIDTFIISLKSEQIIRHITTDPEAFKQWLKINNIRDIRKFQ